MFKIEFDAVVEEYTMRMITSLFYAKDSTFELTGDLREKDKEEIFISVLKSMVRSGSAQYRYRSSDKVDEFRSTDKLIKNWGWLFNGASLQVNRFKYQIMDVSGNRSRFFDNGWQTTDSDNPYSAWPS
jgi:hypothetical protein